MIVHAETLLNKNKKNRQEDVGRYHLLNSESPLDLKGKDPGKLITDLLFNKQEKSSFNLFWSFFFLTDSL